VTGSTVNVRAEPTTASARLGALRRGAQAKVVDRDGIWVGIVSSKRGLRGWMHGDYVKPAAPPQQDSPPQQSASSSNDARSQAARTDLVSQILANLKQSANNASDTSQAKPQSAKKADTGNRKLARLTVPKPRPARRPSSTRSNATSRPPLDMSKRHTIYVYGDSLATNLYTGLTRMARRYGKFRVKRRTRGATGLVRDDEYDWYAKIKRWLPRDKPDVIVATFGGNDRQSFSSGRIRHKRFTQPWWREYRRRVRRFMRVMRQHSAHSYWLGLPVLRSTRMTNDYAKFNKLYRAVARETGVVFVDTWSQFKGPGRAYSAYGPGVDGRRQKLRMDDGIHFVGAGSKVMAKLVFEAIRGGRASATASRAR